jgi:hypothetical protein
LLLCQPELLLRLPWARWQCDQQACQAWLQRWPANEDEISAVLVVGGDISSQARTGV